jgi:hypothetical protein
LSVEREKHSSPLEVSLTRLAGSFTPRIDGLFDPGRRRTRLPSKEREVPGNRQEAVCCLGHDDMADSQKMLQSEATDRHRKKYMTVVPESLYT